MHRTINLKEQLTSERVSLREKSILYRRERESPLWIKALGAQRAGERDSASERALSNQRRRGIEEEVVPRTSAAAAGVRGKCHWQSFSRYLGEREHFFPLPLVRGWRSGPALVLTAHFCHLTTPPIYTRRFYIYGAQAPWLVAFCRIFPKNILKDFLKQIISIYI